MNWQKAAHWGFRLFLAVPAALLIYRYASDFIGYGEFLHASGEWSVWFLLATLAVTPVRFLLPHAPLSLWAVRRRRDLGIATFCYAFLHTAAYLERKADLALILREGIEPGLLTGWIAFAVFLPLALTSNNASVRWLRSRWKRLHRLVYVAAVLALAHWLLTAFDITSALVHAAILAVILAARAMLSLLRYRKVVPAAQANERSTPA